MDGLHPRALIQVCSSGPPWYAPKPWRTVHSLVYNAWPDPLLADDKRVHFKNQSWEIQKDMVAGTAETYKKLRRLGSRSSRCPLKTVKLENGELTTTETQRQQRWQEHFCRVAAGKLHPDPAYLISVPQVSDSRVDTNDYVDFSPLRILAAMKSLPSHKGCGPDLLPAELLKGEWNVWSLCDC